MTPFLPNRAFDLLAMADLIAGVLDLSEIRLYQNNLIYDPVTTLLADLTPATFVGYAAEVTAWGAASISDDGIVQSVAAQVVFRPTNGVTPNDIYGWYLTTTIGAALLAGGTFEDGPLLMRAATDLIAATVVYRMDGSAHVSIAA